MKGQMEARTLETDEQRSALEAAVSRVGDRWTLLVIDALMSGPRRFGQLQDLIPGIAPNILSQRLKTLSLRRFPNALTSTGITPADICGKKAWASIDVGPTPSQGCVCSEGWRKTMMASGLQQPGNTIFRSTRRLSTYPSTLQRL